jgi:RNase P/RNase MRP subunit POP5
MALTMGKKTKNNRIFVEYLGGASGNLRKAKEFIDLAADELRAYQEAEEEQRSSGKLYTVL